MGSTAAGSPFTIDNLPYGVISTAGNNSPRCATAYDGDAIELSLLEEDGFFSTVSGLPEGVFNQPNLNLFASSQQAAQAAVRSRLIEFLSGEISQAKKERYFIPLAQVTNHWPMATANFSDFYCSYEHTKNCSDAFGLTIKQNWYCIPSVYNGRTSSLRVSGEPVRRPWGVITGENEQATWSPSKRLDFELEMGVFLSKPLAAGDVLDIKNANEHIFGFVILNDWSARDIQWFEIAPLGPFHSKGFGTSISPWIVTTAALAPAQCPAVIPQDPKPLPHLTWKGEANQATWNIELTAKILRKGKTYDVTTTNLNYLYWTPSQQLTHLTSAGEGLATGDIFGTGTISSDRVNESGEKSGLACLFERVLPKHKLSALEQDGIEYLEDGDEVVMEGWCVNPQSGKWFGFGQCRAEILPALAL
ncbi:2-hydroxyhepta-2,4-diene-1,7-dioate isomerase [Aspergillus avenaceus]|uniref:Fumarylacetoacetase n=1 Tax=Aspergillus avenaceus TaxID=36643 RepID=A0A5N6U3M9_ASPAV|nr:2-hydroxyhepta-2,4-diene-1,7-dioate isomerase [Aspergillus avenaceus]